MKQANPTTHLAQACPQWAEKLSAIHHDDLPFEKRMELRQHLETCASCQSVKAEYRAMDALITNLPAVAPLPVLPARLRELTGTREEATCLPLADDTRDMLTRSPMLGRKQLLHSRSRRRAVGLNMAAAVLMVTAIVMGFLILRPAHPSHSGPLQGSSQHAHTPLQHNAYLDVIIGNAHGDSYAVDPQSGEVVWKHQVMAAPGSNPFSANGILYYSGVNNVLYAIDGGDGQPLWHNQLAPNNQNYEIGWNIMAEGELIFVTTLNVQAQSTTIYALNFYAGSIAWQKTLPKEQVQLMNATNGVLYGEGDGLYAWSTKDGRLLWHNSQLIGLDWTSNENSIPLDVVNGKLYFFQSLRVTDGQQANSTPVSGSLEVVDAATGQLLHSIAIKISDPQPMSFVVNGNTLYIAINDNDGTPLLQAYSLSDYHLLWQKTYHGRIFTLSVTGEQIYVGLRTLNVANPRTKNPADYTAWLIALKGNGSESWRWSDPATLSMVAAVEINGVVCVVDGGVVGVRASDGHKLWRTTFSLETGFPPAVD